MKDPVTLWDFCRVQKRWNSHGRTLCSRILNFICRHKYRNIRISDRDEIVKRFQENEHVLYRWSINSSYVDYIAGKLLVDSDELLSFLKDKCFDPDVTYNPDRYTRNDWFFNIAGRETDNRLKSVGTTEKKSYVISDTGVKVFKDFRDNLITDRDEEEVIKQGKSWLYTRGNVKGLSYVGSENSEDALTWNVFRTFMKESSEKWFSELFPVKIDKDKYVKLYFWKEFPPPPGRTIPEGNTHVDLTVETDRKLIFVEAKYKSEISEHTNHDSERDQIIRNIDVGSYEGQVRGKEFFFILLVPKSNKLSVEKCFWYRDNPEMIKEKLPYRKDLDFSYFKDHMHIIYWEDIRDLAGKLGLKELYLYLKEKFPL